MAEDRVPPSNVEGPGPERPGRAGGGEPERPGRAGSLGPTALPTAGARAVAFVAILVGGFCGLLIGRALTTLQCEGSCDVAVGLGGLVGAVMGAVGVAVVAVLVLRATGEWRAGSGQPPT